MYLTEKNPIKAVLTLAASILLSGCYTMFTVPPSDYHKLQSRHNKVEVTLKDKEKVVIEEKESIIIIDTKKVFKVVKDSICSDILAENIEVIKEERIDVMKTILATSWLTVLGIFVIGGILLAVSGPIEFGAG